MVSVKMQKIIFHVYLMLTKHSYTTEIGTPSMIDYHATLSIYSFCIETLERWNNIPLTGSLGYFVHRE